MKRILVIHGPNLNLLGEREPEIYGRATLAEIDERLRREGEDLGLAVEVFQSNHEGALIDRVHEEIGRCDGILINPGGLTHTSVPLRDALAAAGVPVLEIHLSNLFAREEFRRQDLIAPVCAGLVMGLGPVSYLAGLWALHHLLGTGRRTSGAARRRNRTGESRHAGR